MRNIRNLVGGPECSTDQQMAPKSNPEKGYVTSAGIRFQYPGAGDKSPPHGATVHLLTEGGVCVKGVWRDDGGFVGWAPMPKRDPEKEKMLRGS